MTLRTIVCTLALMASTVAFAALKAGDAAPEFSATASLAGKPVLAVESDPNRGRPPGGGCGEFVHCVLANAASRSTESSPSNRRNRLPRFGSLSIGARFLLTT